MFGGFGFVSVDRFVVAGLVFLVAPVYCGGCFWFARTFCGRVGCGRFVVVLDLIWLRLLVLWVLRFVCWFGLHGLGGA